jgi:hypothetical protein
MARMTQTACQVRIYGKNLRFPRKGKSYWTDIEGWKNDRFLSTGRFPETVNVTTKSGEPWSRNLSPIRLGPVATYRENGNLLMATSVEVAWQYSKIYSHRNEGGVLVPLNFTDSKGRPNANWFRWRDAAWKNPEFDWRHPRFSERKNFVRRGFPKGSVVSSFYWDGKILSPVEARREIYAALYCREVVKTPECRRIQNLFQTSDLAIFDFDGYDFVELGMTPEDTIRDLGHSWGHGLLLTLMLQGIDPRLMS